MSLWSRLWNDEDGATNSAEILVIGTVLMLGLIPAVATLRDTFVTELGDFSAAVQSLYPTPTVIPTP